MTFSESADAAGGIGHQTLAGRGEFASKSKTSLFEALVADSLGGALGRRAIGSLHEFGRYVNDLEYRARHTTDGEAARALLSPGCSANQIRLI